VEFVDEKPAYWDLVAGSYKLLPMNFASSSYQ